MRKGRVGTTAAVGIPYALPWRWLQQAALIVGIIGMLSLSFGAQAQGPRQLNRWRDGLNVSYKESRRTERYVAYLQKKNRPKAQREQRAAQAQARRQRHQATRPAPKQPKL